jgi:hypothetical protein
MSPRDRRHDGLYDLQKQPVKEWIVERFAHELAGELAAWPPPFEAWVPAELRQRWSAATGEPPRDDVVRFALEVARLELERAFEEVDRLMREEAPRRWQTPAEAAAGHLVARFVTERCLDLKERAEGARLARADLARAVELAARRRFGAAS